MSARTYGAAGEAFAASALEAEGYRILERNWRSGRSEIDLIAQRGDIIAFVEVKTRKNARFAAAREYVTPAKQARILAAAEEWLQGHPTMLQPRFDVIEVYGEEGAPFPPRINHLENAFGG